MAYMHPLRCLVGGQSFFMIKNAHLPSFINPSKAIFSFFVGMETRTAQICEGKSGDLSCPKGKIRVVSAIYGRLNKETCSSGGSTTCLADRKSYVSGRSVIFSCLSKTSFQYCSLVWAWKLVSDEWICLRGYFDT